jgi:hypothetical protein
MALLGGATKQDKDRFIEVEEDNDRNALSSAIDTSSQNLEGASLRKNLFKFLDFHKFFVSKIFCEYCFVSFIIFFIIIID